MPATSAALFGQGFGIIDQKATGASDDANARFFAVRLVYRVYYKSFQINVDVHTILVLLDDVSITRN